MYSCLCKHTCIVACSSVYTHTPTHIDRHTHTHKYFICLLSFTFLIVSRLCPSPQLATHLCLTLSLDRTIKKSRILQVQLCQINSDSSRECVYCWPVTAVCFSRRLAWTSICLTDCTYLKNCFHGQNILIKWTHKHFS